MEVTAVKALQSELRWTPIAGVGARIWLIFLTLALSPTASADKLDDAHRLLRLTEVAREFEQAASHQADTVVRAYASIVATSTDHELPQSVRQAISRCYREAFAWELFEPGIAAIFAHNLSALELKLLIDFFNDKSVPPTMIGQFRELTTRAETIEQQASDLLFEQSADCQQQNVELILQFLADQGS